MHFLIGEDQVAVADDGGEQVAEVVGDATCYLADGLHDPGLLDLLLADPHQLLGALALADIAGEDQVVLLSVVADVVGVHLDRDIRAFLGTMHPLVRERTALSHHLPTGAPVPRQGAVDLEDGHVEQLLPRVAELPAGGVADEDEAPVGGGPEDLVGGVIH